MVALAVPDSDVSNAGAFVNQAASGSNLWQSIDEEPFSDADWIQRTGAVAAVVYEAGLSNVPDPGVDTGHTVRYRTRTDFSGGTQTIVIGLYQGATLIANTSFAPTVGASFVAGSFALTTPQAAAITDYTDLRIRFTLTLSSGGRTFFCSQVQLEVPDAVASGGLTMVIG